MTLFTGTFAVAQQPRLEGDGAVAAAASDPPQSPAVEDAVTPQRHVLIVVGLAGDEQHGERFQNTVGLWRDWLLKHAGVRAADITILSGREELDGVQPATAEVIRDAVADLTRRVREQDSLWVFLLGHGSQDQRDGWFHLPGADLSAVNWADLFVPLKASEQVFWLTHSASGSFLKPMSRPGRIVITATDPDGEVNETRFPHALAEVMQQDFTDSESEDKTAPRGQTLLSLFRAASRHVRASFDQQQLVPTEHAQLDDNGDGEGTEEEDLADVTWKSAESTSDADSNDSTEQTGSEAAIDPSGVPLDGRRAGRTTIELTILTPLGQHRGAPWVSPSSFPNHVRNDEAGAHATANRYSEIRTTNSKVALTTYSTT